jgi:hypothetical protein
MDGHVCIPKHRRLVGNSLVWCCAIYVAHPVCGMLSQPAEATGRWAGKQFSTVPPKEGKAPDVYLDKQLRSLALVSNLEHQQQCGMCSWLPFTSCALQPSVPV